LPKTRNHRISGLIIVLAIGAISILTITGDNSLSLTYSTYLGGNGTEGWGFLYFDNSNNVLLVSNTDSTDFQMKNAIQQTNHGERDALCMKLDPKGENILYATLYGGSGDDFASGAAIDSQGNMIIVGTTTSTDFPLHKALEENKSSHSSDIFAFKLSSDGKDVIFSTLLGSGSDYHSIGVVTDANDNIIITGSTIASDFLVKNAYQENNSGGTDAFITKITPDGQTVIFSTYFGGLTDDQIKRVTTDKNDNIIVIGVTSSTDQFPITNAIRSNKSSSTWDVFLSKFSADGQGLIFSTFYGGTRPWGPAAVICDSEDNILAVGETNSQDFPVVNAFQKTYGGGELDSFLSKLSSDGQEISFSTFIGGSGSEGPIGISLNSQDDIFLTGSTNSHDFTVKNAFQAQNNGQWEGYLLEFSNDGQDLLFSSYFGGSSNDYSTSVALIPEANDSLFISGHGNSRDLTLVNPYQDFYGGGEFDLFLSRLEYVNAEPTSSPTTGFELSIMLSFAIIYFLKKKK
jgi:hypothetical protein